MKTMIMVDEQVATHLRAAFERLFETALFGDLVVSPSIKNDMYRVMIEHAIEQVGVMVGPMLMNKELLKQFISESDPLYKVSSKEIQ